MKNNLPTMIDITLAEDQLEGTAAKLSQWLVQPGAAVAAGDPVVELETDKVAMEVCAPEAGRLEKILKQPGDDIEPAMVLGRLVQLGGSLLPEQEQEKEQEQRPESAPSANPATQSDDAITLVGPAVRRLMRDHDLDISLICGTGRGGRVTRTDVMTYLEKRNAGDTQGTRTSGDLVGKRIAHTAMRQSIARYMSESLLHTSPHVTSVFELDMSNIIEHRRWHKKEFSEQGVKLTFTAYFLVACVQAIRAVPQVNARFHQDALELFEQINIGVGTALGDQGLVVPVVKDIQSKSLFEIAEKLQQQTEKARTGKLKPADMQNGTFTISNHGVSGSLLAAPIIINQPQLAILGVGKLQKRVVVCDVDGRDTMVIKPMCYVSLTIDHRALDAFQTNQFLTVLVDTMENWGN